MTAGIRVVMSCVAPRSSAGDTHVRPLHRLGRVAAREVAVCRDENSPPVAELEAESDLLATTVNPNLDILRRLIVVGSAERTA